MESKIDNCIVPMDGNEYNSKSNIIKENTEISNTYNDDPEILNSKSKYDNEIAPVHALNVNKMNIDQKNADSSVKEIHKQQTGESLLQSSQNILQSNITMSASKLYQNEMKIFPSNYTNCHKWKNEKMSSSMTNFVLEPQNLANDTTYTTYSDSSSDTNKLDRACLQINRLEDAINEDGEMENVGDLQAITSELHNQLRNQCNANIIDEVTSALNRFELSLKAGKCANTNKEKRKLLLSLINSLQAGLKSTTKATSDTTYNLDDLNENINNNNLNNVNNNINHQRFSKCRNRSLRHTVGVSYKELADARECMENIKKVNNSPAYEEGMSDINSLNTVLSYNSTKDFTTPCLNMNLKDINENKNGDLVKHSPITQQAFLSDNGQINNRYGKISARLANFEIQKIASNTEDSANKRYFMKRANTIDIAKMKNSIKSYNGSNNVINNGRNYNANFKNISVNDKKSKEEKKSIIPPLIPKTLNDIKFLAFINKQNDKANMGWNGTRTNSNWTDKFCYIKKTFESGNSSNTIQTLNANSNEHQRLNQNKYESHTRSLTDLKQKSETKYKLKFNQTLTLKNTVPSIINQFKHAAHSVFKPMPHMKSTGKLTSKTSAKDNITTNRISDYGNQNFSNDSNATVKINCKNKINYNNNQCTVNDGKTYVKRNISLYHPTKNKSENEEFRRRFSVSENSVAIYNPTYTNSELTSLEALPPPININFYYATPSSNPNVICATECFNSSQALTVDHSQLDNLVQKQQQLNNTHDQYNPTIKHANPEAPPLILSYTNPKFDCQDYCNGLLNEHNYMSDNDTSSHTYNIADNFSNVKNNLAEFCAISKIMEKPKCHTATTTLKQLSHITDPNTDPNSKKLKNSLLDIRSNNIKQNNLHSSMPSIQIPQNDTYTSYSVVHSAHYVGEDEDRKPLIKNANDLHQLNTIKYFNDSSASTVSHQSSYGTNDFTSGRCNDDVNNSLNKNGGIHAGYSSRMNHDILSDSQSIHSQNTSYCTYSSNENLGCPKSLNTSLVQNNQLNKTTSPAYITESKNDTSTFTNRIIPKEFANQELRMKYHMQSQNKSNQMPALENNNKNSKYQMKEKTINKNLENNRKSIIISDAPDVIKSSLQIKSRSYDHKGENSYHKKYICDSRLASKNKQDTFAKMQYPAHALPVNTICNNVHDVDSSSFRQHPNNKISNHNIGNFYNMDNVHQSCYVNALRRTKSGINSLAPKKYEAEISKADIDEKQRTVAAYFSGQPSLAHKPSMTILSYSPIIYNVANNQTNNRNIKTNNKVVASAIGLSRSATMPHIDSLNLLDENNVEDAFEQILMYS